MREESGGNKAKEARTHIRLDTIREGLLLEIREEKDKEWVFFKPTELPEMELSEDEEEDDGETDEEEEDETM